MVSYKALNTIISILIIIRFRKCNNYMIKFLINLVCIIGITVGVLNIIVQKYDPFCSMYLGVACCFYTYYDNKKNPVSPMTTAWVSSLEGYVAGFGLILYGYFSLCS